MKACAREAFERRRPDSPRFSRKLSFARAFAPAVAPCTLSPPRAIARLFLPLQSVSRLLLVCSPNCLFVARARGANFPLRPAPSAATLLLPRAQPPRRLRTRTSASARRYGPRRVHQVCFCLLRRARVTCARGSSRVTCDAVKRPRANRQTPFSPTRADFYAPGGSQTRCVS